EVIARRKNLQLKDDPDSFANFNNLANVHFMQGRLDEAISVLKEARSRSLINSGSEGLATLHLQHFLARVLTVAGQLDEAEALARQPLEVRRRKMPAHEGTGRTMVILGRVLVEKNKLDEAEPLLHQAQTLFRDHYDKKPDLAAQAANWLGVIQL